jgi:hypothetical protein
MPTPDIEQALLHIALAETKLDAAYIELDLARAALVGPPEPPSPPYPTACTDRDVRTKPPLPLLGSASSVLVDPCFGSKILRVTDAATGNGSSWRVASNAHVASWSADSSMFFVVGAGRKLFRLDPNLLVAQPFADVTSQCEPSWSRTNPSQLFVVGGPVTRTVQQVTVSDDVLITEDLLDLDTLGLPDLVEPRTYVGGLVTSDQSVVLFFGGKGQDDHHYALVLWKNGGQQLIDTLQQPDGGFRLHSISVDRTGRYVVLYPVQAKPYHMVIWDTDGDVFTPITEAPWGHDTQGYGIEINHDCSPAQDWDAAQWQIRRLDDVGVTYDLITPVLRPKEIYLDDHASWHNARPDRHLPVITATYRYGDNTVEWRAWDDEVIAIATTGPSTVYRFCHHRSDPRDETTPTNTYFWYQPIPSVSPCGRFALFTSNWEKTLGNDPSEAGRFRQDVFLVQLD